MDDSSRAKTVVSRGRKVSRGESAVVRVALHAAGYDVPLQALQQSLVELVCDVTALHSIACQLRGPKLILTPSMRPGFMAQ